MKTENDFATWVLEGIDDVQRSFPYVYEDDHADIIEVFFESESYYAERVDYRMTFYKAFDDNRVVGFAIKDVSEWVLRILTEFPQLEVCVHDGRIKLGLVLTIPQVQSSADQGLAIIYKDLAVRSRTIELKVKNLEDSGSDRQSVCVG